LNVWMYLKVHLLGAKEGALRLMGGDFRLLIILCTIIVPIISGLMM